ncbi:MAG: class SAM-dependent methyltransferase [Marmoricola sp.]|nr:class SAM-dependent methyltransferase [Marmoricola sp.]
MSDPVPPVPPTRWERIADTRETPYVRAFTAALDAGEDVDGEARLADVLLPRGGRVLDAGSGIGRVAEALRRRGHAVVGVEKDPALVAISRSRFPEVPVLEADLLEVSPARLAGAGHPSAYDLVCVVGNVMVYLADGTEVRALRAVASVLAPSGRVLVGFHPVDGPEHSRDYPPELFRDHVEEAGLVVQHLLGGYDLVPPGDDYVAAVLAHGRPAR